jgi:hypothetical protein
MHLQLPIREDSVMGLMIVRHKVKNYGSWKKVFDGHASAQKAAGLTKPRVFRSAEDPNETIILMDYKDLKMAKTFGTSADLKKTMETAGVVDKPTIYFVEPA